MRLTHKQLIMIIGGVIGLIMLALLVWRYWPTIEFVRTHQFNRTTFIHEFRGRGWIAMLPLTLLLAVVSMIPGAPNSVIAILNGVCLGAPLGFVTNAIGLTVGNTLGFWLVNRLDDLRKQQKPSRLLDDLLKMRHPRIGLALGYSVPFIPNMVVHVAASKLQVGSRRLEPLIMIGSLPTAFFYAFGGDAVLRLNLTRIIIAVVVIGGSVGLIWLIRRDRRTIAANKEN